MAIPSLSPFGVFCRWNASACLTLGGLIDMLLHAHFSLTENLWIGEKDFSPVAFSYRQVKCMSGNTMMPAKWIWMTIFNSGGRKNEDLLDRTAELLGKNIENCNGWKNNCVTDLTSNAKKWDSVASMKPSAVKKTIIPGIRDQYNI